MRILQVTTRYPPHIGGIENSVFNLVKRLQALGHDVQVVTSNDPPMPKADRNVLRLPVLLRIVGSWGEMPICPSVFGAVRAAETDIIHAHVPPRQFADMSTLAELTRMKKRPIILHFRLYQEFFSFFLRAASNFHYQTLGYLTFQHASRILVGNLQYRKLLIERFQIPAERISFMPNPVDDEIYDPRRFRSMPQGGKSLSNGRTVLFTGRLVDHKGLGYLIRAFRDVALDHPDTVLSLAGAGPLETRLKQLAKSLGLDGRIRFLGHVSPVQMPAVLASADIFVLPSLFEHSSNSLREALAMEKPVVVTRVGDAEEVIADRRNGLLVPPKNIDSLSDAISLLLDDQRLARRLGREGRKTVKERYSWEGFVQKLLNIYTEVLSEH